MSSWGGRLAVLFALGIVLLALVLPVGALLVRSFLIQEVVLVDGTRLRAVGEVETLDVPGRGAMVSFATQDAPGAERQPRQVPQQDVRRIETRPSFDHYRAVFADARTLGLVENSLRIAVGAVLVALLLGLPLAFVLGRTALPGRRIFLALSMGPAILPPLFLAMGGAIPIGGALHGAFGLSGSALQLTTASVVFGFGLYPLVVLLVGQGLAAVPAGPWEAALLLGGQSAAFRRVVLPAVLPAVLGASTLVFVLALADFAVPDTLGFTLPHVTTPANVFPTEILLQWKQNGNTGRAVATGVPLLLVTLVLVPVSLLLLRRSPVTGGGEGRRGRPRLQLARWRTRLAAWFVVLGILALTLVLPLAGVLSWAEGGGATAQSGTATASASARAKLFDFQGALDRTPGSREEISRWLKTGAATAILALVVAVILVRWALRRGRAVRALVLALGALPLAVPGLVLTVGTLLFWIRLDIGWADRSIVRSVFALTARFLPFALLAAWLALRGVRRGQEEAASLLGAGPATRAGRIWGPLALRGLLGGALVVLILALREVDAVVLVDPRIFPMRLYDKIHFSRLADEANLALLWVGILLVPAIVVTLLLIFIPSLLIVAWTIRFNREIISRTAKLEESNKAVELLQKITA
ncbi:MAG: ABC transporter permease, partial [Planctomycetota bacterium]